LGAELIGPSLAGLADGSIAPRPQPEAGVTYAHKLLKADGRLDWSRPAAELARTVRALSPFPRAWTRHGDVEIKVGAAEVEDWTGDAPPGTVIDDALGIATGAGALRLTALQRPGKAMMPADAFLRGYALGRGERLDRDA
ncbi:MAG: methionyl-tRNA formyltransferase, partial [Alphaproteobacteria bacterium]